MRHKRGGHFFGWCGRAVSILATTCLFGSTLLAQLPTASRLITFGPNGCIPLPPPIPPGYCSGTPSGHSLFEIDPGSGLGTEIPITPPTPSYPQPPTAWGSDSAYDPATGRLFIYDRFIGGVLYTIDAATGAVIHNVLIGTDFHYME